MRSIRRVALPQDSAGLWMTKSPNGILDRFLGTCRFGGRVTLSYGFGPEVIQIYGLGITHLKNNFFPRNLDPAIAKGTTAIPRAVFANSGLAHLLHRLRQTSQSEGLPCCNTKYHALKVACFGYPELKYHAFEEDSLAADPILHSSSSLRSFFNLGSNQSGPLHPKLMSVELAKPSKSQVRTVTSDELNGKNAQWTRRHPPRLK